MLNKIQIKLTRDSVCLTDDMQDHTQIIDIDPQETSQKTIMDIAKNFLPSIGGYGHTWDCCIDGAKIAVIEGNCIKITPISSARFFANGNKLYFKYHSASD